MTDRNDILNKIINPIRHNHEEIGYYEHDTKEKKMVRDKEAFLVNMRAFNSQRFQELETKQRNPEEEEEFQQLSLTKERIESSLEQYQAEPTSTYMNPNEQQPASQSEETMPEALKESLAKRQEAFEKELNQHFTNYEDSLNNNFDKQEENINDTKERIDALVESVTPQEEKKKPSFTKRTLESFSNRLNRVREAIQPLPKAYAAYSQWVNEGTEAQKIAKRALIGGGIALAVGTLSGAALSMATGAAAFRVGRTIASGALGVVATGAYENIENKRKERRIEALDRSKVNYTHSIEQRQEETKDEVFRDRTTLAQLNRGEQAGTLSENEEVDLLLRKEERKMEAKKLLSMRSTYWKNRNELERKLEKSDTNRARNRRYVAMGAGLLGGLTFQLSDLDLFKADTPSVPDKAPVPPVVETPAEPEVVPVVEAIPEPVNLEQIYIHKGEGITHAFLRQIESSKELQEHFGLQEGYSKDQALLAAVKAAQETGYLSDAGEVRVLYGEGAGYELDVKDGKLVSIEHKDITFDTESESYTGGVVEETNTQTAPFEGEQIEKEREYLFTKEKPLDESYQGVTLEEAVKTETTPLNESYQGVSLDSAPMHNPEEYLNTGQDSTMNDFRGSRLDESPLQKMQEQGVSKEVFLPSSNVLGAPQREFGLGSAMSQARLAPAFEGLVIPQKLLDLFQNNPDKGPFIRFDDPTESSLVLEALGVEKDPTQYNRTPFRSKITGQGLTWKDIYERVDLNKLNSELEKLKKLRGITTSVSS